MARVTRTLLSRLEAVVEHVVAQVVGRPVVLPADLMTSCPDLHAARWRAGGLALRAGGWALGQSTVAGITLGNTIFLADPAGSSVRLLLHELGHVRQFQRDKAFPIRYLWESVRHGYARNRFEIEADQFAEEVLWSSTQRRQS